MEAPACYAGDAGTYKRNALTEESNGMSCHPKSPPGGICINGTCLYDNETCQCNKQVPGNLYGEILSQWIAEKADAPWNYVCAYPGDINGISEMVDASNSLWMTRKRWSIQHDETYKGYTECPVTNNMRSQDMVDAILIRLPLSEKHGTTLCDYDKSTQIDIQRSLAKLHNMGFQSLPVVFLEQAKGMPNRMECNKMWGGIDCMNGYRKEIFAQTHVFDDGSCLAVPEGCLDVYYFPADENGSCTVSSNACMQLEHLSPFNQFTTGTEDSFFLAHFSARVNASDPLNLEQILFDTVCFTNIYFHCWDFKREQMGQETTVLIKLFISTNMLTIVRTFLVALAFNRPQPFVLSRQR